MQTLRLLLLAAGAFAGEVAPAGVPGRLPVVAPLYAPPPLEWTQPAPQLTVSPIEASLARLAAAGVEIPKLRADLPAAERLQALAPVVEQLAHLGIDAAKFGAEKDHAQDQALELALSAAKDDVAQKAHVLAARAKTLVWSERGYNKAQRDELYAAAWRLGELKDHYLELVPSDERDAVLSSELQARARFHDVQKALVEGTALPTADALTKGRTSGAKDGAAVSAQPATPRSVGTTNAVKLLEDMRNTKSGWGQRDLDAVYRGFGFVMEEGGDHRKYYHPKHPRLWTTVARHNDLAPGYAQTAVKLIDELERLEGPALPESAIAERTVPPLPKPSPEPPPAIVKAAPQAIVKAEAPLNPIKPAAPKPKTPPPTETLAPAQPRAPESKPEPPASAPAGAKPAQEPGWLEKLKRLFGLGG